MSAGRSREAQELAAVQDEPSRLQACSGWALDAVCCSIRSSPDLGLCCLGAVSPSCA